MQTQSDECLFSGETVMERFGGPANEGVYCIISMDWKNLGSKKSL